MSPTGTIFLYSPERPHSHAATYSVGKESASSGTKLLKRQHNIHLVPNLGMSGVIPPHHRKQSRPTQGQITFILLCYSTDNYVCFWDILITCTRQAR